MKADASKSCFFDDSIELLGHLLHDSAVVDQVLGHLGRSR